MRITYTTENGRLKFELEAQTGKMAFEIVAAIQELFEEDSCGECKSKRIRCNVREYDGNKYFKLACSDCGAQLDFGQFKDSKGLFVKRTDKDKKPIGKNGWYHWNGAARPVTISQQPKTDEEYGNDVPF